MGQFKVHVQYIIYGCCAIELLIGDKLIKCDAGYGGPNPLASLIEACLDFFTAKKQGFETEDYIEETDTTWDEEPGEMFLGLKLLKNNLVIMDIQQRDDEKNVLQEWHETVPYEDFKEAIVSEGFRVLNAFGIFGYYAAWSAHEDFPLAALLRLTGNIELNWDGDNCFTDLSKELACLSSYIEKLQIKEETHYDECKLYYEAWQLQCSEDTFAVGDKVDWTCVMPAEYKNAHGIIIDFEEEHHGFAKYSISGTVTQIIAERSEFPKGERVVSYPQAKTIQEEILRADGHEKDFSSDKEADRTFWGYIVTLKDAVVKPLSEKECSI